jgi:chromate transporter
VIRIGKKSLRNPVMWAIAATAFVGIFFLRVPFPVIVLTAAFIGYFGGRLAPGTFAAAPAHAPTTARHEKSVLDDDAETPAHCRPTWTRALRIIAVCGLLWWLPILLAGYAYGWDHTLFKEGLFFSKAALVTFGGAYAVLPYVAQQAAEHYHWLSAAQMMDGLGLAETTPGPLIMVLQFVGFMGGWNQPGGMSPLMAATAGALITTWATFVPCFLLIFLGAPYIEKLRGNKEVGAALATVTAAVVGVVLNLAVWFGIHVVMPAGRGIDWFAVALATIAFVGIVKWKWDVIAVVVGAGAIGLLYRLALA